FSPSPPRGGGRGVGLSAVALLRLADVEEELELLAQIACQVGALEEEQRKAGIGLDLRAGVAAAEPAAVGGLGVHQQLGAPVIPVLLADGPQVIEHTNTLDRPEKIQIDWRTGDRSPQRPLDILRWRSAERLADVLGERLQALLDGGVL